MKTSIKPIKSQSITIKLLFSMICLIIISIFFVSLLSYLKYTSDLEKQFSKKNQQIINQVAMNIDTYLDDLFRLSLSPYYNDEVMDALDTDIYGNDMKYLQRLRIVEGFLDEMMIIPRNDIIRVMIITDEIYRSERISTSLDNKVNYKHFDWYKRVMHAQQPIFIPANLEQLIKHPKNIVFSVVNILRSTRNTDKILGVIKVDANYSGIEAICNKISMGKKGGILIFDRNKNIIYSSVKEIPYGLFLKIDKPQGNKILVKKYNDEKFLINSIKITRPGWTILSVSSVDEINQNAKATRNNAFLMAIICAGLAVLIIITVLNLMMKPFMQTIQLIKKVEKGDLTIKFPEIQRDEVGYLNISLNRMLAEINETLSKNTELIKEVYEAEYLQKDAQLKALSNQIKPHFIYNTLNMISIMIQCGQSDKAVENINKLSTILRSIANWNKEVTLGQEVELLTSYLDIQANRYIGRLSYSININNNLYSYCVPPLLFQPIAENSVIHGCENKKEQTNIHIWSEEQENSIIIYIEDDGIGIDNTALGVIRANLFNCQNTSFEQNDPQNRKGIGLVNINRRIKLKYGNNYGLYVESFKGIGTKVRIEIAKI